MPRILVAVGVFALIVFSIGFNTARYSVVWEMVGASSHPSQPSRPSNSAAAPESSAAAQPEAAAEPIAFDQRTPVELPANGSAAEDSCRDPWTEDNSEDEPAMDPEDAEGPSYEDTYDYTAQLPDETEPSIGYAAREYYAPGTSPVSADALGKYAASVGGAETFTPSAPGERLAPVVRPGRPQEPACDRRWQIDRLPPVDQVVPLPADG